MKDFGKRFGVLRRELDMSQTSIAKRIDMDGSYLSRIERGEANPNKGTIARIGKGMDFEYEDFVQRLLGVELPIERPYVPVQPGDDLIELRGLLNMIELTKDRVQGLRSLLHGWLENPPEKENGVMQ